MVFDLYLIHSARPQSVDSVRGLHADGWWRERPWLASHGFSFFRNDLQTDSFDRNRVGPGNETVIGPFVPRICLGPLVTKRMERIDQNQSRLSFDRRKVPDFSQFGTVAFVISTGTAGIHDVVFQHRADSCQPVRL